MPNLKRKLENKTATIGIVGLGYVGLPLAIAFANAGLKVLGFDVQQTKVDAVNKGQSYISDVSDEALTRVISKRLLKATSSQGEVKDVDAVCICVPTPLTRTKADLSYVIRESEELSKYIQKEQLVVLESTTYPGTTRGVMLPILERSGLKAGRDFYLAYSPERVDPSNKKYNIKNTPKIVSGIDPVSTELSRLLYLQVADVVLPVSSTEVAEMTKVFENVFRNINIALVNELAQLCEKMGISVWEVIDTAATKPFGYMPFYPGPGVGGHCIPLDPYYLANKAKEYDFHTRFIELAAEINEHAPYYIASRIMETLDNSGKSLKGARILVLGVAYKKDVRDTRESPALKVLELLAQKGAKVSYHDPYIPEVTLDHAILASTELTDDNLASADCVVITTDHSSYDLKRIAALSKLIFDARGVTRGLKSGNIIRLGEG